MVLLRFCIISDLILRMDKNWLLKNHLSQYDIEGIVLIDELETHLHIELQKKILPFLTGFFPKIQFISSTHSPYILNSISNATDKAQAAIKSLQKAQSQSGSYNTPKVNAALWETFHGKCYICENRQATSYQVEHLLPYRKNMELKYDWNNLFLACTHCNNTKLDKYDPILDCTKDNIEELIAFRKKGHFGTEEELIFEVLLPTEQAINT